MIARILKSEAFGSLLLLLATVTALLWANSPWVDAYERVWAGLRFWVNDALMAVFFLSVGLEIRAEFLEGDLRSLRMAALPLAAALGGVVLPAVIYLAFNSDPLVRRGWAIPTATDIAFAIAVFTFLGRRAAPGLRALLLAIAVIDDIVAILVIAFFYAEGIELGGLAIAALGVAGGWLVRRLELRGVAEARGMGAGGIVEGRAVRAHGMQSRWTLLHVLPAVAIWVGLLRAGVHPALTGVIVALLLSERSAHWVQQRVGPWVVFVIMPLFALANAGVTLQALTLDPVVAARLAGGIIVALLVGKPVGIILAAALGVKLGVCALPPGIDLRRFAVIGFLGGIGFTMSLFVCNLAFVDQYLATAKLAVLLGSTLAAIGGLAIGRMMLKAP